MNRNASPLVKILLVAVFFSITMLLSGVRLHHDAPQSVTTAQKMAKNVSMRFPKNGQSWNHLAEKNPLLILRLASRH